MPSQILESYSASYTLRVEKYPITKYVIFFKNQAIMKNFVANILHANCTIICTQLC